MKEERVLALDKRSVDILRLDVTGEEKVNLLDQRFDDDNRQPAPAFKVATATYSHTVLHCADVICERRLFFTNEQQHLVPDLMFRGMQLQGMQAYVNSGCSCR